VVAIGEVTGRRVSQGGTAAKVDSGDLFHQALRLLSSPRSKDFFSPGALQELKTALLSLTIDKMQNLVGLLSQIQSWGNASGPLLERLTTQLMDITAQAFCVSETHQVITLEEKIQQQAVPQMTTQETSAARQAQLLDKLTNLESVMVASALVVAPLVDPFLVPTAVAVATVVGRVMEGASNAWLTVPSLRAAITHAFHEGTMAAAARFIESS
jgi:hypothetical protein